MNFQFQFAQLYKTCLYRNTHNTSATLHNDLNCETDEVIRNRHSCDSNLFIVVMYLVILHHGHDLQHRVYKINVRWYLILFSTFARIINTSPRLHNYRREFKKCGLIFNREYDVCFQIYYHVLKIRLQRTKQ